MFLRIERRIYDEDDIAIIEIYEDELESVYRLLLEEKKERERKM